ncbi:MULTISPECIES: iron uptake system protein EfeO [unclassified Moraxella]|uniref:iron uptake system protein EfeO n=1 Tax=unclassified Moraxella TaxID=2685852 RepID=UPI003AF85DFA
MSFIKTLLPLSLALATLTACQKPAETTNTTPASAPASTATGTATSAPTTATASASTASAVDLSKETAEYKAWVTAEIDQLVVGTEKFVTALNAGNVAEAKKLYPLVRMHFERSEPIAESFGDLDPRIDNREADLEQGEKWTGFHTIEKILWTQNTTKGTEALGKQLIADVKELRAKIPTAEVTGDLMVQGSVDLLNEVSTTKITGEEEIFSKTDLYDFKANIEGAEKIYQILKPKIEAKDPALATTLAERFKAVNDLLAKHQVGTQDFKSYEQLTKDDTKALAEAVNKLGEPLAQMGVILK